MFLSAVIFVLHLKAVVTHQLTNASTEGPYSKTNSRNEIRVLCSEDQFLLNSLSNRTQILLQVRIKGTFVKWTICAHHAVPVDGTAALNFLLEFGRGLFLYHGLLRYLSLLLLVCTRDLSVKEFYKVVTNLLCISFYYLS